MKLVRLLEWRRRRGLSQKELAKKSGVGRPAISEYETLKREAHSTTAQRLAAVLGINTGDLLYREDLEHPGWGKQYGNLLKVAREQGGYKAEIALLQRWAEESQPGPGRSVHEAQAAEAAIVQAVMELDLAEMPGRAAGLVRSYLDLAGSFVAAGVSIPAGLARSLVQALEKENEDDDGEEK